MTRNKKRERKRDSGGGGEQGLKQRLLALQAQLMGGPAAPLPGTFPSSQRSAAGDSSARGPAEGGGREGEARDGRTEGAPGGPPDAGGARNTDGQPEGSGGRSGSEGPRGEGEGRGEKQRRRKWRKEEGEGGTLQSHGGGEQPPKRPLLRSLLAMGSAPAASARTDAAPGAASDASASVSADALSARPAGAATNTAASGSLAANGLPEVVLLSIGDEGQKASAAKAGAKKGKKRIKSGLLLNDADGEDRGEAQGTQWHSDPLVLCMLG